MTEADRLAALRELNLLDTAPEKEYDDLVHLAAAICRTPIGTVSLVDEARQWFKASIGLKDKETHRNLSFCAHAIQQADVFIIEDATVDPRFTGNDLVTGDPHIRFYAGVPLHAPSGAAIGTLCVIDTIPRQLEKNQIEALKILAGQVQARLELRMRKMEMERLLAELAKNVLEKAFLAEELEASRHMFRSFMENSPTHALVKDDQGKFIFYNREVEEFYGINTTEWLGRSVYEVVSEQEAAVYTAQDREVLSSGRNLESIDEIRDKFGRMRKLRSTKFTYKDIYGLTMLAIVSQDITDQVEQAEALAQANARLELMATTDALTGLSTRRVFTARAAVEFSDWKRHQSPFSILVMDVDNFKQRNDRFGHAAGDEALKTLGEILRTSVRAGDVAARLGGEEFAILLPSTKLEQALEMADRFQRLLREANAGPLPLTVSIGASTATPSTPTWEALVSEADNAMYAAKRSGKDRIMACAPLLAASTSSSEYQAMPV